MPEINVDAIVGPSHHFGGLGVGNVASQSHASTPSSPKKAALEGLQKAELVASLGIPQFLFLPPMRPRFELLTRLGFQGDIDAQIAQAAEQMPRALSACFSSAFMWAANSSTVAPSSDTRDGKLHFTTANLISSWHRAFEAEEREQDLKQLFGEIAGLQVHSALPSIAPLRDEGAANHMRLCGKDENAAVHVFVHGESEESDLRPDRFLARHTLAASRSLATLHGLEESRTFYLHQHPDAISAGVFHNDVIATSHQDVMLHHEYAFADADAELARLDRTFKETTGQELKRIMISDSQLPLADAVASYFFNSQLLTPSGDSADDARMVLVCPQHCEQIASARQLIETLLADTENPIDGVHYVSLGESMANGGGPACLRLRVTLTDSELAAVDPRFRVDSENLDKLRQVIEREYPDRLAFEDFQDSEVRAQIVRATDCLHQVVMGS
ncbi:MAG: N-succinylarginine dihydrolase [Planctomycetota bacterium]